MLSSQELDLEEADLAQLRIEVGGSPCRFGHLSCRLFCWAKKHFWTQQVVDSTNASQDMMK